MSTTIGRGFALVAGMLLASTFGTDAAYGAGSGTKAGYLKCEVAGAVSFIFGSSRDITCLYRPEAAARVDRCEGEIKKFGVDIGFYGNGVMIWAVVAPTSGHAARAIWLMRAFTSASARAGLAARWAA